MMKQAFSILFSALLAVIAGAAAAADYSWKPDKPITIIVPWSAGGSTDSVTRVLAADLEDALGAKVVVVNQPGASGSVGTTGAWEAAHDGYTWAAGAASDLGTYPVLGMLDVTVDKWRLYLHVANVAVVGVNADTPYQDFGQLLEAMKAKPGEITVATAGVSSAGHNAMEAISQATGVEYRHVTYDGGNPAVISTVSGETQVTTQLASEQAEMIRAGRIRPLAVIGSSALELKDYGSIPPITQWIPDMSAPVNYFGIWAPQDAPAEVLETMDQVWANAVSNSPRLIDYAADRGAVFDPSAGEEAQKRAMGMISQNAWLLFDGGKAQNSPEQFGIPKP
jgi:tripartite-type tricarboxylate transporter receptor subunit TctC